jgi:hypothetical protein
MNLFVAALIGALLATAAAAPTPAPGDRQIRIGIGFEGPISNGAAADIERMVDDQLGVHTVPIVPPGPPVASAKRFVGGDPDDRLDGTIVFALPPDSFKTERDAHEVKFSGTYQITTLNLSTMAEDRHQFTFSDSEQVASGITALVALPAQALSERATGRRLLSSSGYQASQSVQARVEGKLLAATRLYLASSPLREVGPLNPRETAEHLLDNGEGEAAMAVFRSIGINDPRVNEMIAAARQKMAQSQATAMFGRALGAAASGNAKDANTLLASYEKEPAADHAKAASLARALGSATAGPSADSSVRLVRAAVPGLDSAAFATMLKQLFDEQTGAEPQEVSLAMGGVEIVDKAADAGVKTRLDSYAIALGKAAELMSVKCGCAAQAQLRAASPGALLMRARFEPSFNRPQVGLP